MDKQIDVAFVTRMVSEPFIGDILNPVEVIEVPHGISSKRPKVVMLSPGLDAVVTACKALTNFWLFLVTLAQPPRSPWSAQPKRGLSLHMQELGSQT